VTTLINSGLIKLVEKSKFCLDCVIPENIHTHPEESQKFKISNESMKNSRGIVGRDRGG